MNKNQIVILALIVTVIGGASYFAGSAVLGDKVSKPVEVESIETIPGGIDQGQPDPTVFTREAINPTVPVRIGPTGQNPLGN